MGLVCGDIGFFCGDTGLFGGDLGLFSRNAQLFCGHIRLFFKNEKLSTGGGNWTSNNYDCQNTQQVVTGVPIHIEHIFMGVPKIPITFSVE